MPSCFVIMPMSNPETELVWHNAYKPAITGAGFLAIRIDEEDVGNLLPTQIFQNISQADLLVADLTLARPNCYLGSVTCETLN